MFRQNKNNETQYLLSPHFSWLKVKKIVRSWKRGIDNNFVNTNREIIQRICQKNRTMKYNGVPSQTTPDQKLKNWRSGDTRGSIYDNSVKKIVTNFNSIIENV